MFQRLLMRAMQFERHQKRLVQVLVDVFLISRAVWDTLQTILIDGIEIQGLGFNPYIPKQSQLKAEA